MKLNRLAWCLAVALLALLLAPEARSAAPGPKLIAGDGDRSGGFFSAGPGGAVIGLPGAARIELEAGATMRVFSTAQRLRMPGGYAVDTWSVVVREGRVRAVVPKPRQTAVLLTASAEFSIVVARGTGVLIAETGEAAAANLEGESHTIVDGRWASLGQRSVRSLRAGAQQATTESMLGGTQVHPGRRAWVAPLGGVSVSDVSWTPIAGASKYTVTLTRLGEEQPVSALETTRARLSAALGPLGPGRYQLRVRGTDARGLPGAWSEAVDLRVLGVELPEGGYVSSTGSIHLGLGQHARFTHAEDLELTHTGANYYLPGTSDVPLHMGGRTMVSFRAPDASELCVAKLEPRNIAAEVKIGPKRARWPEDEVEIEIRLIADGARPPPEFIEPRPLVTLGIEPVEVAWRWEGSVLKGLLQPRRGVGPWVVRVEVEDQFGLPLGRNLLEVVASTPSKTRRRAPGADEHRPRVSQHR